MQLPAKFGRRLSSHRRSLRRSDGHRDGSAVAVLVQRSAVPNRRTRRHPPPQLSPHVDRKTQNPIGIKCLSFRASETQQLRETGVTEIFWEPSASGAHLSEWARPAGRAATGDAMRGPLFHWPISFTQGREDYLPRKLATNRDGRIRRRKEPLQGSRGLPATEILAGPRTRRLARYAKYYSKLLVVFHVQMLWQSIIMGSNREDISVEDNL